MIWSSMTRSQKRDAIRDGVARDLTTRMIGAELRCSRNAIIGFAHRNGIALLNHEAGCTVRDVLRYERDYGVVADVRRVAAEPGVNPWAEQRGAA